MKFGIRTPSLKRRVSARLSWKRYVRHSLGVKMPRGLGLVTNPKKALYNRVYNRTSISVDKIPNLFKSKQSSKPNTRYTTTNPLDASFWLNTLIFLVLTVIFFPLGILFILFKLFYKKDIQSVNNTGVSNNLAIPIDNTFNKSLVNLITIPEPTHSLVWITDEDTSKISSTTTIKVTMNISTGTIDTDDGHNFYGEPSLIWTNLPIEQNSDTETEPMYYPSYAGLTPKQRFQYINWLKNVENDTNLSYVFLYYYGLERHLLVGNYDWAVDEILRLIRHHNKDSFKRYAITALIAGSAFRKRPDIVERAPIILETYSNESLLLRRLSGKRLTAKDIIGLSSSIGFTNNRYIKLYPDLFEKTLNQNLLDFENENGDIFSLVNYDNLPKSQHIFFANTSLPDNIRTVNIPTLIEDSCFSKTLRDLLTKTHTQIKQMKKVRKKL